MFKSLWYMGSFVLTPNWLITSLQGVKNTSNCNVLYTVKSIYNDYKLVLVEMNIVEILYSSV